ncbi:MAG: OBG GTPase family GTP-binding protein [Halobacteriales archaeon]
MGVDEEIQEIEEEIAETPYNKATEQHIGRLKAKLSKLREKQAESSGGDGGEGYAVPKQGDATVAFVGYPSVGKSTLLNALTNAESETGSYEFTTLEVVPGMMEYRGARIQLLDVPGLISGAAGGRGRGREVMSVLRNADLLLFLVDVFEPEQYERLRDELHANGLRLDATPPDVKITRRDRGSIDVRATDDLSLSDEAVAEVLREHGIVNARVVVREDVSIEELNDAVLDNRVYVDTMVAVNKVDVADEASVERAREKLAEQGVESAVGVSAEEEMGLDVLRRRIYGELDLIRVYMRPRGGEPDYDEPLVLHRGASVGDAARKIHREFEDRFQHAQVWGDSAKHEGQQVGVDHVLEDEDVLTLVLDR